MAFQHPLCFWFTGLSGAGKTTLCLRLRDKLVAQGYSVFMLDGDELRTGLCSDLGYSKKDRAENIRRAGELAKLMVDAGLIVLVGLISPFADEREKVRQRFSRGQFFEVFVDTPLSECERRDVKGLYEKARSGSISEFTGISSPYEPPLTPDIHVRTLSGAVDEHVDMLFNEFVLRQI